MKNKDKNNKINIIRVDGLSQYIQNIQNAKKARKFSDQLSQEMDRLIDAKIISSEHFPLLSRTQNSTNAGKWRSCFISKGFPYMENAQRTVYTESDVFFRLRQTLKEQAQALGICCLNQKRLRNAIAKSALTTQIFSYIGSLISFVEKGRPDVSNIDNKTLARMIEVQFYTNMAEFVEAPSEEILKHYVFQVKGWRGFFKGPGFFPRIGMGTLMIVGLGLDVYNLVVNSYRLSQLKEQEEYLRPILITSMTLSRISLGMGIFSLAVWGLGAMGYIVAGAVAVVIAILAVMSVFLAVISTVVSSWFNYKLTKEAHEQIDTFIQRLEVSFSKLKKEIQGPCYDYKVRLSCWVPYTDLPIAEVKLRKDQILCLLGDVLYRSDTTFMRRPQAINARTLHEKTGLNICISAYYFVYLV